MTQRTNAAWEVYADGGLKTLYSYDDNGNLTDADTTRLMEVNSSVSAFSDAQWDYQWNPRDQLTRASLYNPWSASSGYEVEYRYCLSCDGSLSERILRNPADQVVSWQRYEYDGLNLVRVDERYDSDADGLDTADPWRVREVSTHRPGQLAALMQKQVYTYTGASGVPSSTDVFTYAYDHIGNVVAVADSSGNREFAFTQDAFGNELDIASSPFNGDPWSTAAAVGITEHQTGKWLDDSYLEWTANSGRTSAVPQKLWEEGFGCLVESARGSATAKDMAPSLPEACLTGADMASADPIT